MTILSDNQTSPRSVTFQCNNCNKQFIKSGAKLDAKMLLRELHYCKIACCYEHRRNMTGSFKPANTKIALICETCGNGFQKWRSTNPNASHRFCSKKCYGRGISTGIVPMNIEMTDEVKAKIGKETKERYKTQSHPFLGRRHTEESKAKMSLEQTSSGRSKGSNNPMYGKHHTDDAKASMSEKHSLAFVEGRRKQYGKNGHKHGTYTSSKTGIEMTYRSSWELATMKWLDANPDVQTYSYESLRIPYWILELSGVKQKRHYVPDFLVTFTDARKELWELKPAAFSNNTKTEIKQTAAKTWCFDNSVALYRLLSKEQLKQLGILL